MVEGTRRRRVQDFIDHVTVSAITSDMPLCFYCTVMPNKIVSCKNSREKQHVFNEGASRGNKSLRLGFLIKINFYILH